MKRALVSVSFSVVVSLGVATSLCLVLEHDAPGRGRPVVSHVPAEVPPAEVPPAEVPGTSEASEAPEAEAEEVPDTSEEVPGTPGDPGEAPLIVIDPGHGGTNTGAPGVERGFYEKELSLALAMGLTRRLRAQGYRVVLTRERDVYLTLRQRVRMANQEGADLFVSLHANATPHHGRYGYETFILTPDALDVDGRALRVGDGPARPGLDPATAHLLDDLEAGAAIPAAADLAAAIQDSLRAVRGPDGDRGVRQESMHVLLGATMPAVLVEVGFVDHAVEGRQLRDPQVQSDLCDAIARAIARTLPLADA